MPSAKPLLSLGPSIHPRPAAGGLSLLEPSAGYVTQWQAMMMKGVLGWTAVGGPQTRHTRCNPPGHVHQGPLEARPADDRTLRTEDHTTLFLI